MSDKIFVIIPTYNEKGNIEKLLSQIFTLRIENLHSLVVDDNSPDGTGDLVDALQGKYPNLSVLHRSQKQGLGQAYIAGFQFALQHGADIIIQMDADLSHDPKYIIVFLKTIKECDLVLGSRYVKGGGVANWNFLRRAISRFGNIYARLMLNLPYQDLTGGFKCYRRQVIEDINLDKLNSLGYNFQIETTYAARRLGFAIKEVPIIFTERVQGASKFSLKIIMEGFWKVFILRFSKH